MSRENKNNNVVLNSMKWSTITEVLAKLILPITNMVLARILMPDDFGALAIVNMFLTGIDIVTDAGFGKYLIQKDYSSEQEKENSENVAFWTNFSFSLFFGLLLVLFSNQLANFFDNPELAPAFRLISVALIFTSFSSVQQNILRRDFQFKKLFYIRLALTLVPVVVTVPLALITRSFWSLIIGQITSALLNAVLLMIVGDWKPKFYYSFSVLKGMLSFSIWSMMEAVGHWLIFWIDTFFASYFFTEYYLGLYKNTQNMIFSIFSIITASVGTVLFSTLSRIKDDYEYQHVYLSIQKLVSFVLFPMSLGLMFFSRNVTLILLGANWLEAANIFIAGGFMMLFNTLFYSFPAEIYKSKGVPKQLFILQAQYLVLLIPIVYFSAKAGFWQLVYFRAASILILTFLSLRRLKVIMGLDPKKIITSLKKLFISGTPIVILGLFNYFFVKLRLGILPNLVIIGLVAILQLIWLYLFFKEDILKLIDNLRKSEVLK